MSTKLLTADEFIRMAREHAYPAVEQLLPEETIYGWIRWDATQPDYVLFSNYPEICARLPLHKDRIESIQLQHVHLPWRRRPTLERNDTSKTALISIAHWESYGIGGG
jgi:hypothetical protein